jgi:O-antigen/teichoic acid export membrane protein
VTVSPAVDGAARADARVALPGRVAALWARPTVRNTAWLTLGYASRLVLQLGAFALLARVLAPAGFGAFAGALALVTLLSPLVELGSYGLVVRDVSTGVPVPRAVGSSLLLGAALLPVGLAAAALLKPLALPMIPWRVVLALAAAEMVGARLVQLAGAVHAATGTLWRPAVMETASGALRLALVGVLFATGGGAGAWSLLYLAHATVVGGLALAWTVRGWGRPVLDPASARARLRPGAHFAVGGAAQSLYTDLDKAMLPRLSTLDATGVYSAAARLIAVAHLPLNAFLGAMCPRFFAAGPAAPAAARRLAWRVLPLTAAYGALVTLGLWLCAPLLTQVLGEQYHDTVRAVRLLALVPLLQALWYPFADAMTGSGRQPQRTRGQIVALGINAALNVWLIPAYGWAGAVWATLASELVLLAYLVTRSGE